MILKNFYYRLFLLTIPVLGVSCIFIGNNPSDFDGQTESIDDYYLYIHEDVLHIAIAPNEGEELLIGSGFWLVIENTYEQPVSIATDAGVRITRIISKDGSQLESVRNRINYHMGPDQILDAKGGKNTRTFIYVFPELIDKGEEIQIIISVEGRVTMDGDVTTVVDGIIYLTLVPKE